MPTNQLVADISSDVRMRWRETYVSEGLNKKMMPLQKGIYRGFGLETADPTAMQVTLVADPTMSDHIAVFETDNGYSMTIHKTGGDVPVDMTPFAGQTIVLALVSSYAVSATTTASIWAYDLATFLALPANTAIGIGTVVVPGGGAIPAASVTLSNRNDAWSNRMTGTVLWDPQIRNSGFRAGPSGTTINGSPDAAPFWRFLKTNPITGASLNPTANGFRLTSNPNSVPANSQNFLLYNNTAATAFDGWVFQELNVPVLAGNSVKMRVSISPEKALTAGEVDAFFQFADAAGAVTSQTTKLYDSATGASSALTTYDVAMAVPASKHFLVRAGIFFNSVQYGGAAANAAFVDSCQVWVEQIDNAAPYSFKDYRGTGMVKRLTVEDVLQSAYTDIAASLRFDKSTPASEGQLILERRDAATANPPALNVLGRIYAGASLVSTAAAAATPRIIAPYDAAISYTLLTESVNTAGAAQGARIYVTNSGWTYIVSGAKWNDGTSEWDVDAGASDVGRLGIGQGYLEFQTHDNGASFADAAWQTIGRLGTGYEEFARVDPATYVPSPAVGNFSVFSQLGPAPDLRSQLAVRWSDGSITVIAESPPGA